MSDGGIPGVPPAAESTKKDDRFAAMLHSAVKGIIAAESQPKARRRKPKFLSSESIEKTAERPADGIDGVRIPGATASEITTDDVEIARLAAMPSLQYERERGAAAERMGCRTPMLDKLVMAARERTGVGEAGKPRQGKPVEIADIEAWPEPADGAALLDELIQAIREYVAISQHQADAVTLWVLHSHAAEAFDIAPYLWLRSAERRSGKSRLIGILKRLVRRALGVSGINAAALLRLIELHEPTLLLDELDPLFKGERELAEAVRGIINSGFDRSLAVHIKNVPASDGGWEPRAFSTYGPKVLSGIGELPATIADRSIPIEMKRKRHEEKVRRLRARDGGEFADIARKLTRWARDHIDHLEDADPTVPDELNDRAADAWAPLFAVADEIGGTWPQRAREAAIALNGEETSTQSRGEQLLADIRAAFDARGKDRISSDDLVAHLIGLDEHPWSEINKGKPLTKAGLARLLRPFKIKSGSIRLDDDRTPKGYYRDKFEDAFARYLPSTPDKNATTPQAKDPAALRDFQNATSGNGVALQYCERPSASADCGVVADRTPPPAENGDEDGDLKWQDEL